MKYTILNLNSHDNTVIADDITVIGIDRTWKFNPSVKMVYFTRFDAFMEFISVENLTYGMPMCGSELVNESNKLGRFNVLRNLIRIKKLQYYNYQGEAEVVINTIMAGNEYIRMQKIKTTANDTIAGIVKQEDIWAKPQKQIITDGPLVSVILTHYNRNDIVRKSIESLLNQTYANIELLIIDDCSAHLHFQALVKYVSGLNDKRIKLYRLNKNCGPYVCKNEMIKVATGQYITMQDSDDTSELNRIEEQVKTMSNDKIIACSVGVYRHNTKQDHPFCLAAVLYRRSIFEEIGFFDSVRYGADSEFNARMRTFYNSTQIVTINKRMYHASFGQDCLTSIVPQGSKIRNDYYASSLIYHSNTDRDKLYVPYPCEKRKFYASEEMTSDVSDLKCSRIDMVCDAPAISVTTNTSGKYKSVRKLTVVIPVRTSDSPMIALRSLAKQTFQDFDIIVSYDNDLGANYARNAGFALVSTPLVLFSDCDIRWSENALHDMYSALEKNQSASYAYGWYEMNGQKYCNVDFDASRLKKNNYICTMSMIRTSDFCGFDEKIRRLQDWDLWLTMLSAGKTGTYIGSKIFETEIREGITHGSNTISWQEARNILVQKHKL